MEAIIGEGKRGSNAPSCLCSARSAAPPRNDAAHRFQTNCLPPTKDTEMPTLNHHGGKSLRGIRPGLPDLPSRQRDCGSVIECVGRLGADQPRPSRSKTPASSRWTQRNARPRAPRLARRIIGTPTPTTTSPCSTLPSTLPPLRAPKKHRRVVPSSTAAGATHPRAGRAAVLAQPIGLRRPDCAGWNANFSVYRDAHDASQPTACNAVELLHRNLYAPVFVYSPTATS